MLCMYCWAQVHSHVEQSLQCICAYRNVLWKCMQITRRGFWADSFKHRPQSSKQLHRSKATSRGPRLFDRTRPSLSPPSLSTSLTCTTSLKSTTRSKHHTVPSVRSVPIEEETFRQFRLFENLNIPIQERCSISIFR